MLRYMMYVLLRCLWWQLAQHNHIRFVLFKMFFLQIITWRMVAGIKCANYNTNIGGLYTRNEVWYGHGPVCV